MFQSCPECGVHIMTPSNGNISRVTPFVQGIHRLPVNSPHKGQRRGALMFFICASTNGWVSKQSRRRWFETPSRSLWRHCNDWRFFLDCCLVYIRIPYPCDTVRNNGVVITSKRRHFDVIKSKWRRFDVTTTIITSSVRRAMENSRCLLELHQWWLS